MLRLVGYGTWLDPWHTAAKAPATCCESTTIIIIVNVNTIIFQVTQVTDFFYSAPLKLQSYGTILWLARLTFNGLMGEGASSSQGARPQASHQTTDFLFHSRSLRAWLLISYADNDVFMTLLILSIAFLISNDVTVSHLVIGLNLCVHI